MNTTLTADIWHCDMTGPVQDLDLHGPYAAEVWPAHGGWAWAVRDAGDNHAICDDGWEAREHEAKAAVLDWAEDDLLSGQLAAEIADDLLSAAFSEYGRTEQAVARAVLAVAATGQIEEA